MTTTTRRALVRVQHAARRLVQAVDALRPKDLKELPYTYGWCLKLARAEAKVAAHKITVVLGPDVPTAREKFAASRDPEDALMEAQDVAREVVEEAAEGDI